MMHPPRIWLDYRPVRIGWVLDSPDAAALTADAEFNSCLWGGHFNPIIPCWNAVLAVALVKAFRVDVLMPAQPTEATAAFIQFWPHLRLNARGGKVFYDGLCEFVDIRHAVRRALRTPGFARDRLVRPTWTNADPLASLLALALGCYPDPAAIGIDYVHRIRSAFPMPDLAVGANAPVKPELLERVTPLSLTGFDLSFRRDRSLWLAPGLVLGDATSFDDLLLFWNLRAAGAYVCFYDASRAERMKPFAQAFLAALRRRPADASNGVNIWSRAPDWPPGEGWTSDLNAQGLALNLCHGEGEDVWNGCNVKPARVNFSAWHRDVVSSYSESEDRASAAFSLPDRPFGEDEPNALGQRYIVTINAKQYRPEPDGRTFATPFVPQLNEFYGRNFYFLYDRARAEPGALGHGAVGIVSKAGDQRLAIEAIRMHDWIKAFFGLLNIEVERSEPGRRCSRLIRQMGGLHGCRVFKVRGARDLIRHYKPDQSFTRGTAETKIGNQDPQSGHIRFAEYENLYIQQRARGRLTPAEVFQFLTAKGVFRVGLEFTCPNCGLSSWIQLDDVATLSTCHYCGHRFDVTGQLKDRDWRYRRSGLFGRDDDQLGSIPAALALQQLDVALHDGLLICTTALTFRSTTGAIEPCEVDFLAITAGAQAIGEAPVQVLFGEAKTRGAFDDEDARKLGKLADAVPCDLAEPFLMFAKTDTFNQEEIRLAQTLNDRDRARVILWSREELEPYDVYERAAARLGQRQYATTLTDLATVTNELWFQPAA